MITRAHRDHSNVKFAGKDKLGYDFYTSIEDFEYKELNPDYVKWEQR